MLTVSAQRVRDLFDYERQTGRLIWRQNKWPARAGNPAGAVSKDGYVIVGVDMRTYPAHRLIWLHVHGEWPKQQIDHIDGDRANNRLENLRDVNASMNMQNLRNSKRRNKSCGLMGVSFSKNAGRWMAAIKIGSKNKYLGYFDTPEKAHAVYLAKKREVHEGFPSC